MSRIISLVFALTMVVLAESADRGYIVKIGDSSPDFSLTMLDGKIVSLKDLKGKIVVLQFTASWCSVCRIEMPHLEKEVWQRFKDQDFVLIGIDRDEPLDVVKKFKQEMKVTYPMALDPGSDIFALFAHKNAGVTRNIVLDRHGEIVFLTRLFEKQEFNQMIEKIEKLLAVDKKS